MDAAHALACARHCGGDAERAIDALLDGSMPDRGDLVAEAAAAEAADGSAPAAGVTADPLTGDARRGAWVRESAARRARGDMYSRMR